MPPHIEHFATLRCGIKTSDPCVHGLRTCLADEYDESRHLWIQRCPQKSEF